MLDNIFGIAGSALNAQIVRMNTTASNLANAPTVANSEQGAFRAKRTVFATILEDLREHGRDSMKGGIKVTELVNDPSPINKHFDPNSPVADKEGYVYRSNVSEMSEMVEMMAAARSYQNNVEAVSTAKHLLQRTLDLTKS